MLPRSSTGFSKLNSRADKWEHRYKIHVWYCAQGKAHPCQNHSGLSLGHRTCSSKQGMAVHVKILKCFGLEGTLKVTFHQPRLHSSRCFLWRVVQWLHLLTQGKVSLCWYLWLKPRGKHCLCCLKGDEAVQSNIWMFSFSKCSCFSIWEVEKVILRILLLSKES